MVVNTGAHWFVLPGTMLRGLSMEFELLISDKDGRIEWTRQYKTVAATCADADWYIKAGYHVTITSKGS